MTPPIGQGTQLGDNELVLRIGRGGMATVWVARQRRPEPLGDRLVAVKVMLDELADEAEFVKMFLDEVRLMRSIQHPNVVEVYDVGQSSVMWMSMEWLEGESLHALIAEAGKRRAIPPDVAVRIVADVASGLHAAHELRGPDGRPLGVVHRDVSPQNILISTNGSVKLVDFGVAKALGRVSEATRTGQLKGKFGYMSPEQALGKAVDRRSDVFALGVVLFEVTTNRRLFRGDSDIGTLKLITSGSVPKPSNIDPSYPPELERIVLRALERKREARYQTALEFAEDLRAFLKAQHVVVPSAGIAGLLKRVLGERIEKRRKGVRDAIKLMSFASQPGADLLPSEAVFTPTGPDKLSVSGISGVTASGVAAPPITGSGASLDAPKTPSRNAQGAARLHWLGAIGYAIGVLGLVIALVVLLLLGS
ncbi:MAG TPA: serine/threonine-protein kinase [Polyangiaceae bacterium]|nr:serine/threonine-protein kinase [Polyangiaceae bacterium]